mmetsp:Transcript_26678/g.29739  ORF Transcript_26678/g.29739 Transcript_26678/m.29739 type:complete len:235 (-) Transcript_26678:169-873(-)
MAITWQTVMNFVKLLEITKGRDKFSKLLQYTAWAIRWYLVKYQPTSKELAQRFQNFRMGAGGARKLFRLGRSLVNVQKIRLTIMAASHKQFEVSDALTVLSNTGLAAFFFFDHGVMLSTMKAFDWDKQALKQLSARGWFWGLFFGLCADITGYQKIAEQDRAAKLQKNWLRVKELSARRAKMQRQIVARLCDLVAASRASETITFWSEGFVAGCGILSASIGMYELWPKKKEAL